MMKTMKKLGAALMALAMMGSLAACGNNAGSGDASNANVDNANLVYAVEAGSAGEAAAQENGYEYNSVALKS